MFYISLLEIILVTHKKRGEEVTGGYRAREDASSIDLGGYIM